MKCLIFCERKQFTYLINSKGALTHYELRKPLGTIVFCLRKICCLPMAQKQHSYAEN
jgi:hypothetical protein